MSSVSATSPNPWIVPVGEPMYTVYTHDGQKLRVFKEVIDKSSEYLDDPAYIKWRKEQDENIARGEALLDKIARGEYVDIYWQCYSEDGHGARIYLGSRGDKELTQEQLRDFQERYGSKACTPESRLQMFAELTELGVIDSRIAMREIYTQSYKVSKEISDRYYGGFDGYMNLIQDKYINAKNELSILRSQLAYDLLQEEYAASISNGYGKLISVFNSIFK